MIKGYFQQVGIDYEEIYAPIIKHNSIKSMFAILATYKMFIVQSDIGITF